MTSFAHERALRPASWNPTRSVRRIETGPTRSEPASRVNVGPWERLISGGLGIALVARGLRRPSPLGVGIGLLGAGLVYRAASGHCSLYEGLVLGESATKPPRLADVGNPVYRGHRFVKTVTIQKDPEEVYRFWRRFENFPRFTSHLESVVETSPTTSHWVLKGPAGLKIEWDSELIADRPNEFLSWRSVEGSQVAHAGSVKFRPAPGDRGTEIEVQISYEPPIGGSLAIALAKVFGFEPEQQAREDLRRLKRLLETGEIATTEGQTSCSC